MYKLAILLAFFQGSLCLFLPKGIRFWVNSNECPPGYYWPATSEYVDTGEDCSGPDAPAIAPTSYVCGAEPRRTWAHNSELGAENIITRSPGKNNVNLVRTVPIQERKRFQCLKAPGPGGVINRQL